LFFFFLVEQSLYLSSGYSDAGLVLSDEELSIKFSFAKRPKKKKKLRVEVLF